MYGYVTSAIKFIFETSLLSYCAVIIVANGFLSGIVIMKFKSNILKYYIVSPRGDHFSMVGSVCFFFPKKLASGRGDWFSMVGLIFSGKSYLGD